MQGNHLNRRTFLATVGAGSILALAGCSGSEEGSDESTSDEEGGDSSENAGNESGQDDEEGGEETQNIEDREVGENVEENAGLVIQDHEMVVDEGEYSTDITVEGTVENTTDETKDYVQIDVRVYDADGNQLDNYMTNTQNLQGGGTWAFDVMILEEEDDIEEYDIGVTDSAL